MDKKKGNRGGKQRKCIFFYFVKKVKKFKIKLNFYFISNLNLNFCFSSYSFLTSHQSFFLLNTPPKMDKYRKVMKKCRHPYLHLMTFRSNYGWSEGKGETLSQRPTRESCLNPSFLSISSSFGSLWETKNRRGKIKFELYLKIDSK